jgi:hypothetical protein
LRVDLCGAAKEARTQEGHPMFGGCERGEEQPSRMGAHARAEQLIGLDYDRHGHDELSADLRHECCGQAVSFVASVGRRDERPGVRDDPHRAVTTLRR